MNRIQDPDLTPDNGIQVASLLDVAATKLATIQQPAQARDYEDIAAIIAAGISLSDALVAASTVYGKQFNGALSLKALTYFADGDSPQLGSGSLFIRRWSLPMTSRTNTNAYVGRSKSSTSTSTGFRN